MYVPRNPLRLPLKSNSPRVRLQLLDLHVKEVEGMGGRVEGSGWGGREKEGRGEGRLKGVEGGRREVSEGGEGRGGVGRGEWRGAEGGK